MFLFLGTEVSLKLLKLAISKNITNIAGRLPENSRNRFVDRQSKKNSKRQTKKIRLFIEG